MAGDTTVLLTGATGLVGRFLLAGLMRRRIPTIALVRSQPHRPAAVRIEEALLPFESHGALPRPIVLEADLNGEGLGLTSAHHQALANQPLRILHSAASIRFHAEGPDSEPFATNVTGTEHLLEAARAWHVTQFHHVSTAYVQCDRQSRRTAYEVPVISDAEAGNDYERSKIQSEKLIRDCQHIGIQTFYRPSIVVGDSVSGYTSTYHGFYAPLQIAATLVRTLGIDRRIADHFREHLGLASGDCKNIVPVDWLAAAILRLMDNRSAHGGIYHLTHPQPARLSDMQAAIMDAIDESLTTKSKRRAATDNTLDSSTENNSVANSVTPMGFAALNADHLTAFRQQLTVYESYFLNDPFFDRAQGEPYLRGLPCPTMDYAALKKLARRALDDNFGWPRPRIDLPRRQVLQIDAASNGGSHSPNQPLADLDLILELLGPSGARLPDNYPPIFCRRNGRWIAIPVLSSSAPGYALRLLTTEQSLRMAVSGTADVQTLLAQGRWIAAGSSPAGTPQADLLELLRDWVRHLRLSDVEKLT